ncbi:MAG TPA: histidine kinase [Marinilabiliales bacterium]|nr:MAG: histidine kinase [Bacteroidetes bacterium GWA2_40_14]OFX57725.1 MAG: histidine kinase [Bacteroidetes bacterium GWC2_40_13]OFX71356.1 MAG: histidine kinase [Bacteroidetes bacterium GWD2_40_43]OFX91449.1 MAG: histidine kinase [Bacteroidetes bacterium GWE2_40_63]OFY19519.1 MAG: histidine kinase [Bacteroidetes bacterium GWF2_40_13]OFZ32216.1 MAG: histidine kinase [Bacteroidetes bacterium RIFOXYC2_FULL_40_12]HAM97678.1 histidine kinase [Marinilabiliales bacterium]
MELVKSIPEKCKLCYACIRVCPSKAIKIEDNYAKVIHDRCIGCGNCISVCAPKALEYFDSISHVKALLNSGQKVIAICAPSISGEFSDITSRRNFVGMIKALGFKNVCEVAFGADLVALKYKELFSNFKGKYYITTNCPSVVYYIEKFHPGSLTNLAPIVSPMIAMAKVVHKKYGADAKVVYIGPCTAAKMEAVRITGDGKVDEVLTFVELRKMFQEVGITENTVEYSDFDPPHGGKGSLFPISRGMFQSVGINEDLLTGRLISTEGRYNFLEAIKEFENLQTLKKHLDLFYCDGGCIMGPGTSPNGQKFDRRTLVIEYTKKRLDSGNKEEWQKNIDEYLKLDLGRDYQIDDQRMEKPDEERLAKVLKALGKESEQDHINCGACGYQTCREFATAVSQGLGKPDMCITFNIKNKQDYIKTLKVTNEKLEKTRQALEESERAALIEKEAVKEMSNTTNVMLQKIPSGVVIIDKELKIIQSNKGFISLLGEDAETINEVIPGLKGADIKTLLPSTVITLFQYAINSDDGVENRDIQIGNQLLNISIFPIKKGEIAGAVIRDMYLPEVRREEVMHRITDVIDKNLKMVQNIGFLLGEGASETEQMLKSIVNSYKSENKK